jgi:hypothetical protein
LYPFPIRGWFSRYFARLSQRNDESLNSSKLSDSMNFSLPSCLRQPPLSPLRTTPLLLAALFCAAPLSLSAQGTRLWLQSHYDEFEKGTPQGVEITSDGRLVRGPEAQDVATTPSSFVWAVAEGKNGEIYAATGTPATVLRIGQNGKSTRIFETKALAVQALKIGPDGALYAATMPDGKVYRLKTDAASPENESTAEVVFDLGKADAALAKGEDKGKDAAKDSRSHYIWDLTFDKAGRLYAATGGPAAIYRIDVAHGAKDAAGSSRPFFHCDEQHIRSMAWDKDGNLLAGTDGSGLVYRISPEGKGYVMYSAPRREITALAVGADGTIYAADVGDKSRNPLPQLPVQAGIGITISFVQPGSMQAANASSALPEGTEIYALTPNQAPRKLWSGKDEVVYQLAADGDDIIAVSGNRGRVFRIHKDGSFGDIAHLDAQLVVALTRADGGWLIGTGNTGKVYRLNTGSSAGTAAEHTYASDVLDASATTRWGRVEVDPESHGYQIWTRSGNVEQPARNEKDWGWSDWQPLNAGNVASPAGRYLQWKAELEPGGVVSGVGVNFLPVNSAPVVDDLVVVPGARVVPQGQTAGQQPTVQIVFPSQQANAGAVVYDGNSGNTVPLQAQKDRTSVTVRWAAHDDDGDDLAFNLYLMGDGEHVWRPLKKKLSDKVYSFDGSDFPDGGYKIKVVATDAPSHAPGEALTGEKVSDRFELDTTPPVITALKAGVVERAADCGKSACPAAIAVSFDARDAMSPISHAEYSVDAGPWQYIDPVGQLSDAKEEHYEFKAPAPNSDDGDSSGAGVEHLITVRAYDRHDNMATAKVIVPAGSR